jgi:carbonic anhydrase
MSTRFQCPNFNQHQAQAVLFFCMDFRFPEQTIRFVKENLAQLVDVNTLPGVAKSFIENNIHAQAAVEVIRKAVQLHEVDTIIMLNHVDCGGYGFSKSFSNAEAETAKHKEDLKEVRAILAKKFPHLKIMIGYSVLAPKGEWLDPQVEEVDFIMVD